MRSRVILVLLVLLPGCQEKPPEPEPAPKSPPKVAPVAKAPPAESAGVRGPDPMAGSFSLEQAVAGLDAPDAKGPVGDGDLLAEIETSEGTVQCELFAERAPKSVANFVGLARGVRPFKNKQGLWVKKPAYENSSFHRVIKGFMIQGGDPTGTGSGEPGYLVPDEIWEGSKHDRRGLLCMANRGKNTNGMQFFITDAAAPHLDGGYTIFGACSPDDVIEKLASVPVNGSRPKQRLTIKNVTISRI